MLDAVAYPSAADPGFASDTERVFLRNALVREIDELEEEAQLEGLPPMQPPLREALLQLGELGVKVARLVGQSLGEALPPLRPALFLDEDRVSAVFHCRATARRLTLDLSWPDGAAAEVYLTDPSGTRKQQGLTGLPESSAQYLSWLLHL